MSNPYSITFGREPGQVIPRPLQKEEVISDFCSDDPPVQAYIITGVRGTGKTVLMTDICQDLTDKDWIVAELNPERDLLQGLAANLSSETSLAQIFKKAKINLSFFGMGLEVSGEAPITDIEVALQKMLESLKRCGKRILVAIDEVTNSRTVREFTAAFQIFISKNLPVFLLMTGLYENIYELQNERSLTFLYRAPKIELGPLNIGAIAANYQKIFSLEKEDAAQMALATSGYSFAFQVLGYLTWESGGKYTDVIDRYRQYLEDFVYEKIWSELSLNDQRVLTGMAESDSDKIIDIRGKLGMTTNQFNPYRSRLIRKGIVDGSQRGVMKFVLPMFRDFVIEQNFML